MVTRCFRRASCSTSGCSHLIFRRSAMGCCRSRRLFTVADVMALEEDLEQVRAYVGLPLRGWQGAASACPLSAG